MDLLKKYEHLNDKLNLSDIRDKKIISCLISDFAMYWVYYLASDNEKVSVSKDYVISYSKKFDVYFVYFTTDNKDKVIEYINKLIVNNYVHFVMWKFRETRELVMYFENNDLLNFDYSLVNNMSEIVFDDEPHNLNEYKKIKYFFACTNILERDKNHIHGNSKFPINNPTKFILDYKYSFTYFYTKLGFCYFQKGDHIIEIANRKNKVFLYSKTQNRHRTESINEALETGKIYEKSYTDEDYFWYFNNYNYYHTPFVIDYNSCKFNLVTETLPLLKPNTGEEHIQTCKFFSEKTIKSLMVATPAYVLLQEEVYEVLKSYGFYFLNEEFGKYGYENYEKFCDFLKNASDKQLDDLFNRTYEKSKLNKIKLEEYIYSDKTKEINLLINKTV